MITLAKTAEHSVLKIVLDVTQHRWYPTFPHTYYREVIKANANLVGWISYSEAIQKNTNNYMYLLFQTESWPASTTSFEMCRHYV